jgi:ribosomal protein S27AE
VKYCGSCETEKSRDLFGKRSASIDGLSAKCKTCQKVYDKARAGDKGREEARRIYAQTDQGKLATNKAKAEYGKRNPVKVKASAIVARAIRNGKLFSEPCCKCGSTESMHAHHDDYLKPMNVRWMCAGCHSQWHKLNGEGLNAR